MTDMRPDDRDDELRSLLHDAVADVAPADRLGEVRRRTRRRAPRRWAPLLVGAGAVAATVVTAGVVVSALNDDPASDDDTPVAGASTSPSVPPTAAAGIYFVSDSPTGPRLYREFQSVGATSDPQQRVLMSLQRLTVDAGPHDPDYRTLWPARSFQAIEVADDRIVIDLGNPDALEVGADGTALGRYGVQQAVYTAEAALRETLPVSFEYDGAPARTVLGVKVGVTVPRDRGYDITAPVNISDPGEHLPIDGGVLSANGTMATNVPFVDWRLESAGTTVLEGRAQPVDITGADARATLGAPGWRTGDIDVSALPPGDYVFVVSTELPGQTSDETAEFSDTRTITIR
jgi:hypothetical protein